VSTLAAPTLAPVSPRRQRTDRVMRGLLGAGVVIALIPLFFVLYYVLKRGLGALSVDFFTKDPTGAFIGDQGGIRSAIFGTFEIIGLATVVAVPVGIGVALYLVEYGRGSRFASVVRYFVDVLTGVPSVVFGLFVYMALVVTGVGGGFAGWKGSVAVGLLMLPVIVRSAEVVLLLVPDSLREAALALGAPRWRVVLSVVLPSAAPGLVTGSLLAVARGAGETAPLLFTARIVFGTNFDLSQQMGSLPALIYNDVTTSNDALVQRAWGTALTLIALILILTLIARLVARRSRIA